jgi:ankyrin repeat protein
MATARARLEAAVKAGDVAGIRAAVGAGADVHGEMTVPALGPVRPLSAAALYGHAAAVRVLLELGASATHDDNEALAAAAMAGREEVVGILIAAGARANGAGPAGETNLMGACVGVDVDKALAAGSDALADIREGGHPGTVRALLAAGANVHAATPDGRTALMAASVAGQTAVIDILLAAGANPLHSTDSGTALHFAGMFGRTAAVKRLLEAGARPDAKDAGGKTPLDVVCSADGADKAHEAAIRELLLHPPPCV